MTTSPLARRAAAILLLGGAVIAACVPLPGGRTLTRKEIAGKESDALIATDGSRCPAPPSTIAGTRVGEDHVCIWEEPESTQERTRRGGALGAEPRRPGHVPPPRP